MTAGRLTWLYVPGDRRARIDAALAGDADVVILDLEDAVVPAHKTIAREQVSVAAGSTDRPIQIRVNAAGGRWQPDDLQMVRELPPAVGLRLPKCESVDAVREQVDAAGEREIHLLIESALGVELAFQLARSHSRIASITLGEADLRADLGVSDDAGLLWCRSRIVTASVAAGLSSPAMSVYPNHRDLAGLERSCRAGRELGFRGRTAIHPAQLPVIRRAFTPSAEQVQRARALVTAAADGGRAGRGAVALPDGTFVDAAVLRQARSLLALAAPDPATNTDPVGER